MGTPDQLNVDASDGLLARRYTLLRTGARQAKGVVHDGRFLRAGDGVSLTYSVLRLRPVEHTEQSWHWYTFSTRKTLHETR